MIKASSLIYAIIIALVLGILSASILLSQYFKIIETENDLIESKIRLNAISAINYFLVSDSYVSPSDKYICLYNGIEDSVHIHIEKWGMLDIITAAATIGRKTYAKTALVGDLFDKKNDPALYLTDNNIPLSLCGKTVIKGNCSLPKSGVKRAYIEGQNFSGTQLVDGKISLSKSSLPAIDKKTLDYINSIITYTPSPSDSIIQYPVANSFCSFDNNNHIIFSNDVINLTTNDFEGRIIIISSKGILVSDQTNLKDVIIAAPRIQIDDGFSGNLQAFAIDSIYIGKNVNLKYPSVIATISGNDKNKHPVIKINEGASIAGLVLMDAGFDPISKKINLNMANGTKINGIIYCNGIVNMNGTVFGSIYCNSFLLKTPSAIYENTLLNSTIDISRTPDEFSIKNFSNTKSRRKIIKWL